ncbi:MAG TPA: peptidoglycan DD-metalloendopeptidase family protein [Thermoanaerobaculia bacterium]|nr:peptidoglycan DD-metalloendopeptidase family protein [Thermoanaerobaculia bacterium]
MAVAVALLLAVLLAPPLRGAALPAAAPAEDREAALERIRGEIAGLQADLSRAQLRERSLSSELEQTRLELTLQERRVAEARAAQELARERVAALEGRVAALEADLERVRGDLHRQLVGLYRLGRAGYLRLLLSLPSDDRVLPAIRQLRYLARRDGRTLEEFLDTRARLSLEEEELAQERSRVEVWLAQEEQRRGRLQQLRREQSQLLAQAAQRRQSLETRTVALAETERKLSGFLAFLYGRNATPLSGTPIQQFRGVLDWPARGAVTVRFGPRLDPRYRTRTPHNGIAIATREGSEVGAVFPGKVLFAAPFQGYGPTVIVHHAGRVFTLYAGLARLEAAYGDVVSLGQTLGTAGSSLYFEIREENRPQDPLAWLRN